MCINTPWLILMSIPFHHHGVRKRRLVHVSTSCLSPLSLILHIKLFCSDSSYAQLSLKLSVQFSSIAQSCLTLCDSMNCSTPGLLIHHQLLEFIQTHIHRVGVGQPYFLLGFRASGRNRQDEESYDGFCMGRKLVYACLRCIRQEDGFSRM